MFPNPHYFPAIPPQSSTYGCIAFHVPSQLPTPKGHIGLGCLAVRRTRMPKATLDKDRQSFLREHEIRLPRQPDATSPTHIVLLSKDSPQFELRPQVPCAANAAHDPRSLASREHVSHADYRRPVRTSAFALAVFLSSTACRRMN